MPALNEEFGADAAAALAALVGGGKRLRASVVAKERPAPGPGARHPARAGGKLLVVLKEEGAERSVNAQMLAGAARARARVGGGERRRPPAADAPRRQEAATRAARARPQRPPSPRPQPAWRACPACASCATPWRGRR